LLAGFLKCGAVTSAGKTCSATLIISSRGRAKKPHFACASYREKKGTCTNKTAVPVDVLDAAVIDALKTTFSEQSFADYLSDLAANTSKIAEYQAQRAHLVEDEMPRLAKVVERLRKRPAAIDDDDVAAEIQSELKEAIQERKAVEQRVMELEGYVGGLKDQEAQVARLREAWGNWAGALDADPELVVKKRALLRKVLSTPIWVRPVEDNGTREWEFAGVSRYDSVLSGGLTADAYAVEHRPAVVDPDQLFVWFAQAAGDIPKTPPPPGTTWSLGVRGGADAVKLPGDGWTTQTRPVISGGSDAPDSGVQYGRATSGPPTWSTK